MNVCYSISSKPVVEWIGVVTEGELGSEPRLTEGVNGRIIGQKAKSLNRVNRSVRDTSRFLYAYGSDGQCDLIALRVQLQRETVAMSLDVII